MNTTPKLLPTLLQHFFLVSHNRSVCAYYNELVFSSSRVISAINDASVRPCVRALVSGWQKSRHLKFIMIGAYQSTLLV